MTAEISPALITRCGWLLVKLTKKKEKKAQDFNCVELGTDSLHTPNFHQRQLGATVRHIIEVTTEIRALSC